MLITKKDLENLEYFVEDDYEGRHFLIKNPFFLFPTGFDEARKLYLEDDKYLIEELEDYEYSEDPKERQKADFIKAQIQGTKSFMREFSIKKHPFMEYNEHVFRALGSSSWYWLDGLNKNSIVLHGSTDIKEIPIQKLLKNVQSAYEKCNTKSSIIYPRAYINLLNDTRDAVLKENIVKTLNNIYLGDNDLNDINPSMFEDIVAELLVNSGYDIYQTPRSRDGGRDLIAKKEISAGLSIELAVEVKRKKVVNITDISRALDANRNYSKLMIVTSGRFSAGVIEEKNREDRRHRLELMDGIGISQLINGYHEN